MAPHLGGPHLETEQVERQLAEAMCEQDSPTVTVVAGGSGANSFLLTKATSNIIKINSKFP